MIEAIPLRIRNLGVVPVVVVEQAAWAIPMGRALMLGGLPCAEITFRTEAAAESIRMLTQEVPELLVGAGTVLSEKQASQALDAGAQFVVSPGFNPRVVDFCQARAVPVFPGVSTPTEIELALEKGLQILKFFPAEALGGLSYLQAISGPYKLLSFIPTGGISPSNLVSYLSFPSVHACGGTWLVRREWLASGDFNKISREAIKAVALVDRVRGDVA